MLGEICSVIPSFKVLLFFFNPLRLPRTGSQSLFECLFFEDPVILKIKVHVLSHKELPKHRDEVLIVRFLIELEFASVIQVLAEFLRVPLSEVLDAGHSLLDLNLFILFFLSLCWEPLPWKAAPYKVHQHYSNLFEVISSSLLDA